MDKRKIIYYSDELNDEFSVAKITPKKIDENYTYIYNSFIKKVTKFFWYRIIATPIAFMYTKIKFRHKTVNKHILKKYKFTGYFMYGNHTQDIADAFIPNMLNFPKDNYVIVHPNNVSIPYLGKITPSLGALPLPDNMAAYRNFMQAVEKRITDKNCVVIYPEAHIWPYYTKIRPFSDASFAYPIKQKVPAFCFTNTYQKKKHGMLKIVTYIDGPFFADNTLSPREQRINLRNQIYECMCKRAQASNHVQIQYIKKENTDD